MKRIYVSLIFFTLVSGWAYAQDPQFSQYYSAPLYLNPAFAGTTPDHRFITNYRNQWPNAGKGYVTYAMSYDYDLYHYNSGIGFMAMVDQAGTAGLRSSEFSFLYSYKLNVSNKWVISSGLNFGYAVRSVDFNKLIFGDQLQFDANGTTPTTDPTLYNTGMSHYVDFNAGMLAYNHNFWFGFAASHLNQPNRSLVGQESTLPVKTTVHGGVRIPLYSGVFKRDRIPVLSPSFVFMNQGKFNQLDAGAYFLYDPIMIGLWYRGIPITKNPKGNVSQDAVVIVFGFQFEKIEFGYSYDMTVSELGAIAGGAHEISLKYKLGINMKAKTKKRERFIPCPTFIKKE